MVELWNSVPVNLSFAETVDILVSPEHSGHVKRYLECSGITPNVIIKDLQAEIIVDMCTLTGTQVCQQTKQFRSKLS